MASPAPRTTSRSSRSPKPSWGNVWVAAANRSAIISKGPVSRFPSERKTFPAWWKPWRFGSQALIGNVVRRDVSARAAEGSAVPGASAHEPSQRAPIDVGHGTVLRARATVGHDPSLRLTTGAWMEENADGLWLRPGL